MSWDFDLCDPVTREVLSTDEKHFMFGGTVCVGGDTSMTLNVTYNYSDIINKVIESEEGYAYLLNGKSGAETIPILKNAISKLSNDVDDDYWKATEGNAKRALSQLLAFAQMRPDGIWEVCQRTVEIRISKQKRRNKNLAKDIKKMENIIQESEKQ